MKTKKLTKLITAILLVSLLALTLFACINPDRDSEGTMTLVVLDGDNTKAYTVDLSKLPSGDDAATGLVAVLDYLQAKGELTYEGDNSIYGLFITKVNSITPQGNEFIAIYTSVVTDSYEGAPTVTYNGVECVNSGVGASSMSILKDCMIVLVKETY